MRSGNNRLDHVASTNLVDHDQLNEVVDNELKFDSSSSLSNNPVKDALPIFTVSLIVVHKYRHTLNSGLTLLWYSGATDIMMNCKHLNPYQLKLKAKKV